MIIAPIIYGLIDPLELEHIRYCGIATRSTRPRDHQREALRTDHTSRIYNWIRKLLREGREYCVSTLQEYPETAIREFLRDEEIRWIAKLRIEGHDLTNATDGGDGCYTRTLEWRENFSKISKNRWANPEFRDRMRINMMGNVILPTTAIKLSEANRLYRKDELPRQILNTKKRLKTHYKLLDSSKGSEQTARSLALIPHLEAKLAELTKLLKLRDSNE